MFRSGFILNGTNSLGEMYIIWFTCLFATERELGARNMSRQTKSVMCGWYDVDSRALLSPETSHCKAVRHCYIVGDELGRLIWSSQKYIL
jgi:hypothetical protein